MTLITGFVWLNAFVLGVGSFIFILRDPVPPSMRTGKIFALYGIGMAIIVMVLMTMGVK